MPLPRASAQLRRRTLTARLTALAERAIRELEEAESVDLDRLAEALELVKLTKLAARPRQRGATKSATAAMAPTFSAGPREVLRGLRAAGVDTLTAPEEAIEDFIASRAPPPKRTSPKRRSRHARNEHHAWMLRRDGE